MTPFKTSGGTIMIKLSQWKIFYIIYSASAIITGTQENNFADSIKCCKSTGEKDPS